MIIDDEPLAHEVIIQYAESFDFLKLTRQSYDAIDALKWLESYSVDLIFLDIHMPKISGMDMLRLLKNKPEVVITSAYEEYAIESFGLDVADYLVKPFSLERFYSTVQRVRKRSVRQITNEQQNKTFFAKGDKKHHQLQFDQISLVEGYGQYCKIYHGQEVILTLDRLSNIEAQLPLDEFLRVHKSYIVSISKIVVVEGNRIELSDRKVPIGQSYRKSVKEILGLK